MVQNINVVAASTLLAAANGKDGKAATAIWDQLSDMYTWGDCPMSLVTLDEFYAVVQYINYERQDSLGAEELPEIDEIVKRIARLKDVAELYVNLNQ